jgi:hypothetical protein
MIMGLYKLLDVYLKKREMSGERGSRQFYFGGEEREMAP